MKKDLKILTIATFVLFLVFFSLILIPGIRHRVYTIPGISCTIDDNPILTPPNKEIQITCIWDYTDVPEKYSLSFGYEVNTTILSNSSLTPMNHKQNITVFIFPTQDNIGATIEIQFYVGASFLREKIEYAYVIIDES